MSRTSLEVDFSISSNLDEKDLGYANFTAATSTQSDSVCYLITLDGSLTDEEILFDNVDGKFLLIKTDQSVSIKLNSSTNTAIPVTVLDTDQPGFLILSTTGLTKIYVTTTVETTLLIASAGD